MKSAARIGIGIVIFVAFAAITWAISNNGLQAQPLNSVGSQGAVPASQADNGFLTGPTEGSPIGIATAYLAGNQNAMGLTQTDLEETAVTETYTKQSDFTQVEFSQQLNGIGVYNGTILVNVAGDGSIINMHNQFVPDLSNKTNAAAPALTAEEAVNAAAGHLGLTTVNLTVEGSSKNAAQETNFNDGGISRNSIPAKLLYYPTGKEVRLAWDVEIYMRNEDNWWSMRVDAITGEILDQFNYVIHEDFHEQAQLSHGDAYMDDVQQTLPGSFSFPSNTMLGDTYRVYEWPVESPNHSAPANPSDGRTVAANPSAAASALGSPFGWHSDDVTDWTNTQGNNVEAQKSGTFSECGATLDCDTALDLTLDPTAATNVGAGIDNLFYWNNITHDVWYNYGFDEASRNFQDNNNGQGGAGSDRVIANAQAPGNCNANFGTPGDGSQPTMNMFNCDIATPSRDGDLDNGVIVHEYTHGISNRLTGGASVSCLSNSEQMGEGWSDWYGLMMTIEAGDTGADERGIGTWLLGTGPDGPGVRTQKYTTNMAVNTHTYGDLPGMVVPHGVGEVWATMVWDVTWALIANGSASGLDLDIYNGTGGNNLAMQLVTDGLKLQPCSPGFVDGRDAILLADQNLTGGANQCLIWETFARRGLGFSADQGSSGSTSDGTEAFDIPASCDFIAPQPTSLDVCVGTDAVYDMDINAAFVAPVTMSAAGEPAGSSVAFSVNPVLGPLPQTISMTVSSIGVPAVGSHTITITGTDSSGSPVSESSTVDLTVFPNTLTSPTLVSPADTATGQSNRPTLSWNSVSGASDYLVEVSDDSLFNTIVYSATASGTSHDVMMSLNALTTYYWRVTTQNMCTTSSASTVFSFMTANIVCTSYPSTDVPLLIPEDGGTSGATNSLVAVADLGTIVDVNVLDLVGTHTWMGDLDFNLSSPLGTNVQFRDRACGTDEDFNINYDDDAAPGSAPCPPIDGGTYQPFSPLSAFNSEGSAGDWTLTINDNAGGDSGQLDSWTLDLCYIPIEGPYISLNKTVGTDPSVCASSDDIIISGAGDVTYCYEVTNTGTVTMTTHDLVDSELGAIFSGLPIPLTPGASLWITQTAALTQTTVNTATWTAYNVGPTDVVSDTDSATVTVQAAASFPVCEGFESGSLPYFMYAETTSDGGANGRVQVTASNPYSGSYALEIDTDCDGCGGATQQAAVMVVDLAGQTSVELDLWVQEFGDEDNPEDGIFISDDGGITWAEIQSLNGFPTSYTNVNVDLVVAAANAGMSLVDGFMIKFQSLDNFSITSDGYAFDDICVQTPPPPTINVSPTSMTSTQSVNTQVTQPLDIGNSGETLTWTIEDTLVTLRVDNGSGTKTALAPVTMQVDDGFSENQIGDGGQFVWFNRFTPAPSEYPITLEEIWVMFGSTEVNVGDAIELVVHTDTDGDGDPGTGAVLVGNYDVTVQEAGTGVWSVYPLATPLVLNGPGDVLIGAINRYGSEGFDDYPAELDQTATQVRSWAATWNAGDVPVNPAYPADEQWGTIDSFGLPGNWMVRGYGSNSASDCQYPADIPWLTLSITNGVTLRDEVTSVDVTYDSTGMINGVYTGALCVNSDDPVTPLVVVPVTMTVDTPPVITVDPLILTSTQMGNVQVGQLLTISNSIYANGNLTWWITESLPALTSYVPAPLTGGDSSVAAERVDAIDMGITEQTVVPLSDYQVPTAVLYDNGPLVNCPACGSGGADESQLQDSTLGMNLFGFGHQVSAGNRVADDFTVTDSSGWVLDEVVFYAYQSFAGIPSTITAVNVQIWDGPPNDPSSSVVFGDTTTNRMTATTWSNIYRVTETSSGNTDRAIMASTVDLGGLFLPAGTYWFDWQTDGSAGSGPWAPPITINGQDTTGNGLQWTTAWADLLDDGTNTPQGLPFTISGSAASCSTLSDLPWVSATPDNGSTAPGGSDTVNVEFDSTGLANGVYTGTLCINSNDLVTPLIAVPLTMTVNTYRVYLPVIMTPAYADLVVDSVNMSADMLEVVITNNGSAATDDGFWVDLYIDPTTSPTGINQTWATNGGEGLAWGIPFSIAAGESYTLTLDSPLYDASESNFSGTIAAGAAIYAQVDAVGPNAYGSIFESNEDNNITGPLTAPVEVTPPAALVNTVVPEALKSLRP